MGRGFTPMVPVLRLPRCGLTAFPGPHSGATYPPPGPGRAAVRIAARG